MFENWCPVHQDWYYNRQKHSNHLWKFVIHMGYLMWVASVDHCSHRSMVLARIMRIFSGFKFIMINNKSTIRSTNINKSLTGWVVSGTTGNHNFCGYKEGKRHTIVNWSQIQGSYWWWRWHLWSLIYWRWLEI